MLRKTLEYALWLIFGTVVFQSVFFFLNMGICWLSLVLATVSWLGYAYFVQDNREFDYHNLISIGIVWLVIVLGCFYYSQFHETTYDGGYYHGNAMVEMLNGWNPFYEANNYTETGVTVWSDYYPKASWFFGANLIQLFGHLSCGMILNLLIPLITAGFALDFVYKWKKSWFVAAAAALIVLLNPIAIEQMHSYYVDAVLGNLTIILLILCAEVMKKYDLSTNVMIVAVSVIMINLKFTGFGFAGIVNLVCWLMLFFTNRRGFIYYTISGFIMVFLGVVVVGFSPYFVNILNLRHIFYPIAGKNAEDVVTYLIPEEIYGQNPIRKFIYSFFCGQGMRVNLTQFEQNGYLLYDERIGAMGLQFPKLVIMSAVGYFVAFFHDLKKKEINWILWLTVTALLFTIAANYKNVWWFRYIPQIWMVVPLGMVLLSVKKLKWLIPIPFVALTLYQCWPILENTIETDYAKSRSIEAFYEDYQGENVTVTIRNHDQSEVYWFDAYEIARAKQEGVVINDVIHGNELKETDPMYFMHVYAVFVVDDK